MTFLTIFFEFCVFPIDFEVGDVMLERRPLRKIGCRVALGTGHIEEFFIKLLFMDTGMTGHAKIAIRVREFEGFLAILHMALLTVGRLMLTRERETSLIMEAPVGLDLSLQTHRLPTFRRVTLVTTYTLELLMERSRMR